MADRYWVGGTGTWNTTSTTNWSATSGGAGGASVPTTSDSVFFNQAGTYTVTQTGALACLDYTVSAGVVTFSTTGTVSMTISGNLTWAVGTVASAGGFNGPLNFNSSGTVTLNTGGVPYSGNATQIFGGIKNLGSEFICGNIAFSAGGVLNTNGFPLTSGGIFGFGTINLGSSTFTCGGSTVFNGNILTINAGTSQILCSSSSATLYGTDRTTGVTFNNVSFTSTAVGTRTINGINTFNNLVVAAPGTAGVTTVNLGGQQTINGTLSTTGTAGNRRVFFTTATYGISYNLVVNSAPSLTDADFRGLYVRGTAAPISGTRIGNRGECRGITFSTPKTVYWATAVGGNWSGNNWAPSSGGAVNTDNFPLPQDTAAIVNAGLNNATSVAFDAGIGYVPSVDLSGRSNALTINVTSPTTVYGNWTNGSGISFGGSSTLTFSGGTTQTITSAGKTFPAGITIDTYGGTVQLADWFRFDLNSVINVSTGNFLTNNNNINGGGISSPGANVRSISLGSSILSLSSTVFSLVATNLTFSAGTSQITMSNPTSIGFSGGGFTFNSVSFTNAPASGHSITGTNTFNSLSFAAPSFAGVGGATFSADQIIGTLTCVGASPVRRVFLRSNTMSTQRTLTVNSISSTDCDFRDINLAGAASGASLTRAGDCGNNAGITFPAAKTVYWNLAGSQNWSSTGWAPSSGGTPGINNFPLAQDTAVFDNAGAAGQVSFDTSWNIGTFDASLRTTAMTIQTANVTLSIYGDLKNGTGVTWTGNLMSFAFSKIGTQTITSNGTPFAGGTFLMFRPGSYVQLADAFTFSGGISFGSGTFDAVIYNVTISRVSADTTPLALKLKLGTGTWTLTGTSNTFFIQGTVVVEGSATVVLSNNTTATRDFGGNVGVYIQKLIIGGTTSTSTTTINGNNTFGELASTKTVAHTIAFGTATTNFGKWSVTGTAGNVVTITGSSTTNRINGPAVTGVDYLAMGAWGVATTSPGEFYAGANSTGTAAAPVFRTAAPSPRNLFWVGGSGNWSETTRWSTSSGGAGGQDVPTSLDTVTFDSASHSISYSVTPNITVARNAGLTMLAPATGVLTFADTLNQVICHGNVNISNTNVTYSYAGGFSLVGNGNHTFTSNGRIFTGNIFISGIGATWTLADPVSISGSITVTYGTFNTSVNNYSVSCNTISSNNSNIRSIYLNGSTVSSTGVNFNTPTNLIFNAGTSNLTASSATLSFSGGGQTFYNVTLSNTSPNTTTVNGQNTFNRLTFNSYSANPGVGLVTFNANQTIGTLTLNAGTTAAFRRFLASDTLGTQRTLNVSTLTAGAADYDFRDIAITGAAAPLTGTRFGDCKGNSGITFPAAKTVYWRAGTENWGAVGAGNGPWSLTSGGALDVTAFPLAQDSAIFPSTIPVTGTTVTINANYNIGTIDMSLRTTNIMTLATGLATPAIYGNWINGTGITLTGTGTMTFAGRSAQTIRSVGKTFTQLFSFNSPGGSITLQDALASSGSGQLPILAGTFNADLYNVTLSGAQISSTGDQIRTINFGSGTWTLGQGGSTFNVSGTNFTALGTATLSFTNTSGKSFGGGGFSYPNITIDQGGAGELTISGDNTLKTVTNSFSATGATTINLNNNTHRLTQPWAATGQAGKILTITGLNINAPASLIFNGVGTASNINHVNIRHIRAYPINDTWYTGPNSTNSGTLGWIFASATVVATTALSNFFLFF